MALAHARFGEDVVAIGIDVTDEQAGVLAMLDQPAQAQARPHDLGIELVHLDIAEIAHDDAALRVEHAQALLHVVERIVHAPVLPAQLPVQEADAGDERDADDAEQGACDGHGREEWGHAGSSVNCCSDSGRVSFQYR
jgi:hypothetical protein